MFDLFGCGCEVFVVEEVIGLWWLSDKVLVVEWMC